MSLPLRTRFEQDEEVQTQLYEKGVATEFWVAQSQQESAVMLTADPGAKFLEPMARTAAVRFMSVLIQQASLRNWFEASLLLDHYWAKASAPGAGGAKVASLPAICVAIVRIVKKTEDSKEYFDMTAWASTGTSLAGWLRHLGYETEATTEVSVNAAERDILRALGFETKLPTLESWLSQACSRIDVFTQKTYTPRLSWVWEQSMFQARMTVAWKSAFEVAEVGLEPRMMAVGLVCVGLVGAQMLPLEAIRSEKLTTSQWEVMYRQTQLHEPVITACYLSPEQANAMLEVVQEAFLVSREELLEATWKAADAVGLAMAQAQSVAIAKSAGGGSSEAPAQQAQGALEGQNAASA